MKITAYVQLIFEDEIVEEFQGTDFEDGVTPTMDKWLEFKSFLAFHKEGVDDGATYEYQGSISVGGVELPLNQETLLTLAKQIDAEM